MASWGFYSIWHEVEDDYPHLAWEGVNNPFHPTGCGNLDIGGGYYTLQNNITHDGDCFIVKATKVTLDFNGYSIIGKGNGEGVSSERYLYATIKNGGIYNFSNGVYFFKSGSNRVENMIISENKDHGIHIFSECNKNVIINNIIESNGNGGNKESGIYCQHKSKDNTFEGNVIRYNNKDGIHIWGCSLSKIINNNISDNVVYAISGTHYSKDSDIIYLTYNNSYGTINWTDYDLINNTVGVTGNFLFGETIVIGDGFAFVNISEMSSKIDSSADITLNTGYKGEYPLMLRKISKDGEICPSNVCQNITPMSNATFMFNVTSWSRYDVGKFVTSSSNVTLYTGWNMFALTMNNTDEGSDRNISLSSSGDGTRNLIGFSSDTEVDFTDLKFTPTGGAEKTFQEAVDDGDLRYDLAHYDNSPGEKRYRYTSMNDNVLRKHKAYDIYVDTAGNLTIENVGGSLEGESYEWKNLMFSNGTHELNISDAYDEGWIYGEFKDTIIQFWNTELNGWDYITSTDSLNSWQGYFIKSNKNNIKISRQD